MPLKKTYKRRPRRRRVKKAIRRGRQSIPRGINSAAVMHFKRKRHEIISVGIPEGGWLLNSTSTGMYKTFDFRLDDLIDTADFTNLFRYYKINAVAVKMWPCNNFTGENAYTGQFSNSQLIFRYDQNLDGISLSGTNSFAGSQQYYQCSQTAKSRRIISANSTPITLYMKLRQSNMIYKALSGTSNTSYNTQRPRWVNTEEKGTAHYGMNCLIHRMSDEVLTTGFYNQQKLRIEYTYYISCKKVQ